MNPIDLSQPYDKYLAYLESRKWAELRNKALERDNYHCSICQSPHNLEVHHLRYPKTLGTEPISDLMTLCDECHKKLENWKKGHRADIKMTKWHPPEPPKPKTYIKCQNIADAEIAIKKCSEYLYQSYGNNEIYFYLQEDQRQKKYLCDDKDLERIKKLLSSYEMKTIYPEGGKENE